MKSWGDFYEGAGGVEYFLDHLAIHKDFLKEILKRRPANALEAGCGSAIMSVFLAMTGIQVTACDRDDQVLKKAAETAGNWKTNVHFAKQDLLRLDLPDNAFDLAFSQGVLEHMSDEEIQTSCREVLRIAKVFIFSVPGHPYKHKDFGNERLLKAEAWQRILKGLGRLELKPYYECRTKRNFLFKKPLMLMGVLSR